jgi:hypothetical protein
MPAMPCLQRTAAAPAAAAGCCRRKLWQEFWNVTTTAAAGRSRRSGGGGGSSTGMPSLPLVRELAHLRRLQELEIKLQSARLEGGIPAAWLAPGAMPQLKRCTSGVQEGALAGLHWCRGLVARAKFAPQWRLPQSL